MLCGDVHGQQGETEERKGPSPQAIQTLSPGVAPHSYNLTRLLWRRRPSAAGLQPLNTCPTLRGDPITHIWGVASGDFSPSPNSCVTIFGGSPSPQGRGHLIINLSYSRLQVRWGHLTTRAPFHPARTPAPRLPGSPWQPSPSPRDAGTRGAPGVPATSPPRGPWPAALARPHRPAPGPAPPGLAALT